LACLRNKRDAPAWAPAFPPPANCGADRLVHVPHVGQAAASLVQLLAASTSAAVAEVPTLVLPDVGTPHCKDFLGLLSVAVSRAHGAVHAAGLFPLAPPHPCLPGGETVRTELLPSSGPTCKEPSLLNRLAQQHYSASLMP
jgi:hypothetical protein